MNLSRRLPVRAAGLLADAVLLRPARRRASTTRRSRRSSAATRRSRRARCAAAPPSASIRSTATAASSSRAASCSYNEEYNDPACSSVADAVPAAAATARQLFRNGTLVPLGVAFVQETTVFREFGPLAGSTMRLAYDVAPKIGSTAVAPDARRRRALLPCGSATQRRARDPRPRLQELGRLPRLPVLRRQLRDARLRLPAVRRPQGVLPERRAALPAHRGGAHADRRDRRHPRRASPNIGAGWLRRRADERSATQRRRSR